MHGELSMYVFQGSMIRQPRRRVSWKALSDHPVYSAQAQGYSGNNAVQVTLQPRGR